MSVGSFQSRGMMMVGFCLKKSSLSVTTWVDNPGANLQVKHPHHRVLSFGATVQNVHAIPHINPVKLTTQNYTTCRDRQSIRRTFGSTSSSPFSSPRRLSTYRTNLGLREKNLVPLSKKIFLVDTCYPTSVSIHRHI